MTKKTPLIHKDMVVGDIVGLYPETADIIMNYGLHCIGCHYNAFETLEQGILGHGYTDEELQQLLSELNDHVSRLREEPESKADSLAPEAEKMEIHLTPDALNKMKSIIKKEKKSGMVLRLEVTGVTVFKYTLNFVDPKETRVSEKMFSFSRGTVKLLADKRDYQKINGLLIDYVKEGEKEGFKMKNPHQERQLLQPAES